MKVDIIVIHFGDITSTRRCISSLQKMKSTFRQIYLINNDPAYDIAALFRKKNITVISTKKNVGFAKGVNMGVKRSIQNNADAILLLNNDATPEKDSIKAMSKRLTKNVGIVGPVISFKSDETEFFDHGGYIVGKSGKTIHDNRKSISKKKTIQPDFVSGCCMLISRKVFEKVGYFDEAFFMYYEDVDFCLRAHEAGFDTQLATDALVSHDMSEKKSLQSTKYIIESNKIFHNKYLNKYPFGYFQPIKDTFVFSFKNPLNSVTYLRVLLK